MQNIRLSGLIVLADWLETMVEDGKAIGIFDSGSGNRRKIAEELTSGLKDQGFKVDCLDVDEVDVDRLAEYDLLAVGGPTHMRKASRPMEEFLKKIENVDL